MRKYGKLVLLTMIFGLILGSLLGNMTYQSNYYFLADMNLGMQSLAYVKYLNIWHYASYIAGKRIFQMLFVVIILRFFVVEALLGIGAFVFSFTLGIFLTYQLLQEGFKGIWMLILSMMPQWIFYGCAIYYYVKGERIKGEKRAFSLYIICLTMLIIGMLVEIYVNPRLLLFQMS